MKCPVCTETSLVITDRQGIEIDYCPQCRGVWLDRGELDKIIERAMQPYSEQSYPEAPSVQRAEIPRRDHDEYRHNDEYRGARPPIRRDDDDYDDDRGGRRRKKKRGLLGELFDFD